MIYMGETCDWLVWLDFFGPAREFAAENHSLLSVFWAQGAQIGRRFLIASNDWDDSLIGPIRGPERRERDIQGRSFDLNLCALRSSAFERARNSTQRNEERKEILGH